MLAWWRKLQEIPGHDDSREFMLKVQVSFEVLKAWNWAKGVDKDYTLPLTHLSIKKYKFMPPPDLRFGSQDCWLVQPCQTLTYTRALQYWAEKAPPLIPTEPCHLVESVVELQQAMEPLVSFTEEEVLMAAAPSNWVEVSLPRLAEPAPPGHPMQSQL